MRFERAVRGRSRLDAPDIDDRGWDMHRPGGWNATEARGPMFGIMVGDTVRLKVVREDLDADAPLFVTVSEAAEAQVEIVEPEGGGPLPADGIVKVKGVADSSSGQTVEVRLGGVEGPVIAEAEPHVFERKTLLVTPHMVSIHSGANAAAATGQFPINADEVREIFTIVKAIYRPLGIHLSVAAAVQRDVYGGFADDGVYRILRNHTTTGAPFPSALGNVVNSFWVAGRCNVFFVPYLDDSLGIGLSEESKSSEDSPHPACLVACRGSFTRSGTSMTNLFNRPTDGSAHWIRAMANDTAHEIGHFLTLWHADAVNSPGREDTYARRQLMHPNNLIARSGGNIRLADIGYGSTPDGTHRGCLLTMKDLPHYAETANQSSSGDLTGASGSEATRIRARMNHANLYGT